MKANNLTIIKKRRLKKVNMVEDDNVEVVNIGKGDGEVDLDVPTATERRRKKVHDEGRIRSSPSKSRCPTGMKKKHIAINKKEVFEGPGTKKKKVAVEEPSNGSKSRNNDEDEKFVSKREK